MVHVPAKFRENTSMRFRVTVRKLNVTDRQTERRTGALQYFPSRAFGAVGDNYIHVTSFYGPNKNVLNFFWRITHSMKY